MKKAKAIIYCRVSSQRQVNEGHGLDSQEQRCIQYAKSCGYEILDIFRDNGVSGGLFDRPAMKHVLECLEKNDTNDLNNKIVVVFDDLKRFARDTKVHFDLKREIYGRNGRVECPNFRFENTPEGKFVETVLAATGELERNQNRRQVIQKMKARLERGYWPFCMSLGLINKKDPIHGKILVSREPYATIFKEGIEKFRDGILPSILDFQSFVNENYEQYGIQHIMSFSTAKETLKEILYAGWLEYPKWNILRMKAKHEGFISIETFEAVQARLEGRAKPWHRKDYHLDFPLRPHVLCAGCNKPMTGSWNTGRSKRYAHYFCRAKGCLYYGKTIPKIDFENDFETLLSNKKPADYLVDLTRDVLIETWDNRLEMYTLHRNTIQNELENIKKEIDDLAKIAGKTPDDIVRGVYEGKIKELVKKKDGLGKQLKGNKYTSEQFGTATDKVFNTLKKPMEMWKSDDYNDKRTILFMYFEDKLTYDYKLGFGTASLAYPVELINEVGASKNSRVEMSGCDPESKKLIKKLLQA